MYRQTFSAKEMMALDETFCVLHSLGTVITQVCNLETAEPDYPSLAELGRLVSEKAHALLEAIQVPVKGQPIDQEQAPHRVE